MWARMKEELFYSRGRKSEDYTVSELKTMIWRYYMSYWNNRRICSANGGLPPAVKRKRYYESLVLAAWLGGDRNGTNIHSATLHVYLFHFKVMISYLFWFLGGKCVKGYRQYQNSKILAQSYKTENEYKSQLLRINNNIRQSPGAEWSVAHN